jgi:hypothetical protein
MIYEQNDIFFLQNKDFSKKYFNLIKKKINKNNIINLFFK